MKRQSFVRSAAVLSAMVSLGATRTTAAQTTSFDPRWQPFIGCWQPGAGAISGSAVCVTPTANPAAVQISSVDKGVVVSRDTIDASGRQQTVNKQGCAGSQNARWSGDNHRVYVTSDLTCTGGLKRKASGVMAIAASGEWLDIQGVTSEGGSGVRIERFRDAASELKALPAEFAGLNAGRELAVSTARVAAAGGFTVADLADAVKQVDTAVVQAWIVERGARFKLDQTQLIALADAGVPGSVTDVMIGVSYPDHFALQQRPMSSMDYADALTRTDSARIASRYLNDRCFGSASYGYTAGIFDPCAFSNGYGYGRGYGYNSFGFNNGYNGYGYSPYGYGYNGYGGFYSAPVVIVKGDNQPQPHGHVVNGRGYSSGDGSGSGTARPPSSGATAPSSGSTGSSGSGSSGGSSSGSSGNGGRTAHPRPPV